MIEKLKIQDLDLQGRKILIRVDFNVPLDKELNIIDDTRIRAALPSIIYALQQGAALILLSHLGRPKEKTSPEFSLAPCARRLSELLGRPVIMASECIGHTVENMAKHLQPGQVLLLENLRFHRGEEYPDEDPSFAPSLSKLGDIYINDAFGTAHRTHSSTTTIAKFFPNKSAAGFLLQKELEFLGNLLLNPKRPFVAILGGAKISTKMGVIKALLNKVDALLIGGAMSYTFLKAQGIPIGDSLYEEEFLPKAKELLDVCKKKKIHFLLPVDHIIAEKSSKNSKAKITKNKEGIPSGWQGMDIGPETIKIFTEELKNAATIFWNGPLGVYETPPFDQGTQEIARFISQLSSISVVGGGDLVAALQNLHLTEKITHISTGGGASLEFIEFGTLPGIEALSSKKSLAFF